MVETGHHVGGDGAEHVVRRFVAHPLLDEDIGFHFVEGHVARAFHQHLAAHLAAELGQFAVDDQLLHLGAVVAVVDGAGAQAVCRGTGRRRIFSGWLPPDQTAHREGFPGCCVPSMTPYWCRLWRPDHRSGSVVCAAAQWCSG